MAPKQDVKSEIMISGCWREYSKMQRDLKTLRENIMRLIKDKKKINQQINRSRPQKIKALRCKLDESINQLEEYKEQRNVLKRRMEELTERMDLRSSNCTEESVSFKDAQVSHILKIAKLDMQRRVWTIDVQTDIQPSTNLKKAFKTKLRVWSLTSEASLRTVLDIFLQDVVAREEFRFQLKIFCEVKMEVSAMEGDNKRLKLGGFHDYTIGNSQQDSICPSKAPDESHLIAVEAKSSWKRENICQCVAEAAALHKARKDAGKQNCAVWGILSNASIWRFIKIDHDGKLWGTDDYFLNLQDYNQEQVYAVYQCLHHIVRECFMASPTTSPCKSCFNVTPISTEVPPCSFMDVQ